MAIPLGFLRAIAGAQIVTLAKQAQFDTKLTQDVILTVGDLVHEVQAERGMTARFLASEAKDAYGLQRAAGAIGFSEG